VAVVAVESVALGSVAVESDAVEEADEEAEAVAKLLAVVDVLVPYAFAALQ
jgi:hypothetical protein